MMKNGHELVEHGENTVYCLKCGWRFFIQPFRGIDDVPHCVNAVR